MQNIMWVLVVLGAHDLGSCGFRCGLCGSTTLGAVHVDVWERVRMFRPQLIVCIQFKSFFLTRTTFSPKSYNIPVKPATGKWYCT